MKTGKYILTLFGPLLFMSILSGSAVAATLNVPAGYAAVQDAVNAAASGDFVVIAPGAYEEIVTIATPGITLMGELNTAISPVEGTRLSESILRGLVINAPNVVIDGLTIDRRSSSDGNAIEIGTGDASGILIKNNIIDNTLAVSSGASGGIYADAALALPAAPARIESNVIVNSTTRGISLTGCTDFIIGGDTAAQGNIITSSRGAAGSGRCGIWADAACSGLIIRSNNISRHSSAGTADAEVRLLCGGVSVTGNTILASTGVGGTGLDIRDAAADFSGNTIMGDGRRALAVTGSVPQTIDISSLNFVKSDGTELDPSLDSHLLAIEDMIRHHLDDPAGNPVLLISRPQTLAATPRNNALQAAVDAAAAGWRVVVAPGSYTGDLTLNKDLIMDLTGETWIRGSLALTTGTFYAPAEDTLWISGDFSSAGSVFQHRDGTVRFFDSAITSVIGGNNTFYNLICTTPGKALTFTSGSTQTVLNQLTLRGESGNPIILRGTSSSYWMISLGDDADSDIAFVDVGSFKNANPSKPIKMKFSRDSGNNDTSAGLSIPAFFTWSGATSTDWNIAANWQEGSVPDLNSTVVIAAAANQPSLTGHVQLDNLSTAPGATLDLAGFNLTVTDSFINDGTLKLKGTETVSLAQYVEAGTWHYYGDGSTGVLNIKDFGTYDYRHLIIEGNNVFTLTKALHVHGSLELRSGTLHTGTSLLAVSGNLDIRSILNAASSPAMSVVGSLHIYPTGTLNAPSGNLGVGVDFIREGLFNRGASTVFFYRPGTSRIVGSNIFNHLSVDCKQGKTLIMPAGETQAIYGNLKITGAAGRHIQLVSSQPGTQWQINPDPANNPVVAFAEISDGYNISGVDIVAKTSKDRGNNFGIPPTPGWIFEDYFNWTGAASDKWDNRFNWEYLETPDNSGSSNAVIHREGALKQPVLLGADVKLQDLSIGPNARLNLNGKNIQVVRTFSNDGILALKGSETVTLTQDLDSGTWEYIEGGSGTLTIRDFGTVDYYNLLINGSATTFSVASALTVGGDLEIRSGTLTAPAAGSNLILGNDFRISGGSFAHNNGTVIFNGDGFSFRQDGDGYAEGRITQVCDVGSATDNNAFFNLRLEGIANTVDLRRDTRVSGNLEIAQGVLDCNRHTLYVGGNWSNADVFIHDRGKVVFDGSGAQTLSSGGTGNGQNFYDLEHNGAGSLTLIDSNIRILDDFANLAGTFNGGGMDILLVGDWSNDPGAFFSGGVGGTLYLTGAAGPVQRIATGGAAEDKSFYNVSHTGSGKVLLNGYPVKMLGSFTNAGGEWDTGGQSMSIGGDWSNSAVFTHGGSIVFFDGAGVQHLTAGGIDVGQRFNNLSHTGDGSLILQGSLRLEGSFSNTAGSVAAGTRDIYVAGNWHNWERNTGFTSGAAVIFENAALTSRITGETGFYDLVCSAAGKTLQVDAGSTQGVAGALRLTGTGSSPVTAIRLRSSTPGTAYNLENISDNSVFYVDVQDCSASSGYTIFASFSRDAGNNLNWRFSHAGNLVTVVNGVTLSFEPGVPDENAYPDISPSATYPYIVYGLGRNLVLRDLNGANARIIKDAGAGKTIQTCRFSPDGSRIAYWTVEGTMRQIGVVEIAADGTPAVSAVPWGRLAEQVRSNLAWSYATNADGRYIWVYFYNYYLNSLQKVSIDTGKVQTVKTFGDDVLDFDILPDAAGGHDRPLIIRKNPVGADYLLTVYTDMTFNDLGKVEYMNYPWTGFAPEGGRPSWITGASGGNIITGFHDNAGLVMLTWDAATLAWTYTHSGAAGDMRPRWSPDRTRLVFIRKAP